MLPRMKQPFSVVSFSVHPKPSRSPAVFLLFFFFFFTDTKKVKVSTQQMMKQSVYSHCNTLPKYSHRCILFKNQQITGALYYPEIECNKIKIKMYLKTTTQQLPVSKSTRHNFNDSPLTSLEIHGMIIKAAVTQVLFLVHSRDFFLSFSIFFNTYIYKHKVNAAACSYDILLKWNSLKNHKNNY